jgi:acetyl esterase/lipase
MPKLLAGAWAPLLAFLGGLGAALGWFSRDSRAIWTGLLGAALGIRHTIVVTREPPGFDQAFGPSWRDRLPAGLKPRLTAARYRLIQPAPPVVPGQRNVNLAPSGATGQPLLCDIWQPPAGVPRTGLALIYLHGGAWQAFDKDFLTQPLFRRLAGQGHLILDLAYSLAPGADLNRMLGDVKQAVIWLKSHASQYAIHPERLVLMGVSGGAHLALLAAYAPHHPAFLSIYPQADMSIRAVISLYGVTDLSAFFQEYGRSTRRQPQYSTQITDDLRPRLYDRTWLDKFLTRSRIFPAYRHGNLPGGALLLVNLLGGTLNEIPHVYRLASPLAHVGPHCPPTLQLCAGQDFFIAASHGRRLHQALCAAGVPSVHIEYPESVHGFDQYFAVSRRIAPAAQAATCDIERFLGLVG